MEADFCKHLRQLESRRRKPVFERLYNFPAGSHRSPVLGLLPRNLLIISVKPSYPVRRFPFVRSVHFTPNGGYTALRAEGTLHSERRVHCTPSEVYHRTPSRVYHRTPNRVYHRTPSEVYHRTPSEVYHRTPNRVYHRTPSGGYTAP